MNVTRGNATNLRNIRMNLFLKLTSSFALDNINLRIFNNVQPVKQIDINNGVYSVLNKEGFGLDAQQLEVLRDDDVVTITHKQKIVRIQPDNLADQAEYVRANTTRMPLVERPQMG